MQDAKLCQLSESNFIKITNAHGHTRKKYIML